MRRLESRSRRERESPFGSGRRNISNTLLLPHPVRSTHSIGLPDPARSLVTDLPLFNLLCRSSANLLHVRSPLSPCASSSSITWELIASRRRPAFSSFHHFPSFPSSDYISRRFVRRFPACAISLDADGTRANRWARSFSSPFCCFRLPQPELHQIKRSTPLRATVEPFEWSRQEPLSRFRRTGSRCESNERDSEK